MEYVNGTARTCCVGVFQYFVQELNDVPFPHDEDRTDWGAVAQLMPRPAVLDVLRYTGLDDPRGLIAAFPDVPPGWVLLRAAWVLGRAVAVHLDGRRVWMPESTEGATTAALWEQRLVRLVRRTMQPQPTLTGAVGVPIGECGADGVLVVFPEVPDVGW